MKCPFPQKWPIKGSGKTSTQTVSLGKKRDAGSPPRITLDRRSPSRLSGTPPARSVAVKATWQRIVPCNKVGPNALWNRMKRRRSSHQSFRRLTPWGILLEKERRKRKRNRDKKSSDSDSSGSESDADKKARHTAKDSSTARQMKPRKAQGVRVERVETVIERRRNQEPCALNPRLLERLSSKNMASHSTDFFPMGDGSPHAAGRFRS